LSRIGREGERQCRPDHLYHEHHDPSAYGVRRREYLQLYSGFTFGLVVTDTTDGATGEFVGTSTGGTISSNSSTIDITWSTVPVNSPGLGLGPNNSLSGNSGSNAGETTVQGTVSAARS
jgi:hypothetical protein